MGSISESQRHYVERMESITEEQIRNTSTYSAMNKAVFETLKQKDKLYYTHGISFSAQDDLWANSSKERTGFPLHKFLQ